MTTETITDRLLQQGHNIERGTGGPCEKCWADAYTRSLEDTSKDQSGHYEDILREAESEA